MHSPARHRPGTATAVAAACWLLVHSALLAAPAPALSTVAAAHFTNPIARGADPWFVRHDGKYVSCSAGPGHAISVAISEDFTRPSRRQIVWRAPATGPASSEIWAPEMHRLDGRWYIYFAASNGQNANHRTWVLQSEDDDPLGPYTLHGPMYTGDHPESGRDNRWAIDATVFELGGKRYMAWSGWKDTQDVQWIYIARMKDPFTLETPRVRLCDNDDHLWERVSESARERGLHEAPQFLERSNRVFLVFSCSGSWQPTYKLGLLELKPGGDPLNPAHWTKHPRPVFESTTDTFGVGHNCFVKSPDGREDWMLYHAKRERREGWNRTIYAQPFHWTADGFPDFGSPVNAGQLLPAPSGTRAPVRPTALEPATAAP